MRGQTLKNTQTLQEKESTPKAAKKRRITLDLGEGAKIHAFGRKARKIGKPRSSSGAGDVIISDMFDHRASGLFNSNRDHTLASDEVTIGALYKIYPDKTCLSRYQDEWPQTIAVGAALGYIFYGHPITGAVFKPRQTVEAFRKFRKALGPIGKINWDVFWEGMNKVVFGKDGYKSLWTGLKAVFNIFKSDAQASADIIKGLKGGKNLLISLAVISSFIWGSVKGGQKAFDYIQMDVPDGLTPEQEALWRVDYYARTQAKREKEAGLASQLAMDTLQYMMFAGEAGEYIVSQWGLYNIPVECKDVWSIFNLALIGTAGQSVTRFLIKGQTAAAKLSSDEILQVAEQGFLNLSVKMSREMDDAIKEIAKKYDIPESQMDEFIDLFTEIPGSVPDAAAINKFLEGKNLEKAGEILSGAEDITNEITKAQNKVAQKYADELAEIHAENADSAADLANKARAQGRKVTKFFEDEAKLINTRHKYRGKDIAPKPLTSDEVRAFDDALEWGAPPVATSRADEFDEIFGDIQKATSKEATPDNIAGASEAVAKKWDEVSEELTGVISFNAAGKPQNVGEFHSLMRQASKSSGKLVSEIIASSGSDRLIKIADELTFPSNDIRDQFIEILKKEGTTADDLKRFAEAQLPPGTSQTKILSKADELAQEAQSIRRLILTPKQAEDLVDYLARVSRSEKIIDDMMSKIPAQVPGTSGFGQAGRDLLRRGPNAEQLTEAKEALEAIKDGVKAQISEFANPMNRSGWAGRATEIDNLTEELVTSMRKVSSDAFPYAGFTGKQILALTVIISGVYLSVLKAWHYYRDMPRYELIDDIDNLRTAEEIHASVNGNNREAIASSLELMRNKKLAGRLYRDYIFQIPQEILDEYAAAYEEAVLLHKETIKANNYRFAGRVSNTAMAARVAFIEGLLTAKGKLRKNTTKPMTGLIPLKASVDRLRDDLSKKKDGTNLYQDLANELVFVPKQDVPGLGRQGNNAGGLDYIKSNFPNFSLPVFDDVDFVGETRELANRHWPRLITILIFQSGIKQRMRSALDSAEFMHRYNEEIIGYDSLNKSGRGNLDSLKRYRRAFINRVLKRYVFIYDNSFKIDNPEGGGGKILKFPPPKGVAHVDTRNQINKNLSEFEKEWRKLFKEKRKNKDSNTMNPYRIYMNRASRARRRKEYEKTAHRECHHASRGSNKLDMAKNIRICMDKKMKNWDRKEDAKVKKEGTLYNLEQIREVVKLVLKEGHNQGYSPYPYLSHAGDEEELKPDYMEDWKALELALIRDTTKKTAIDIAKILVNDLELFGDILDIAGQNQSVGSEVLRKLEQNKEKDDKV